MVLIAREDRRAVFEYLLREGVIVVKKDAYLPAHQHCTTVTNLKVMMIVKSLKSKGCLNEVYTWGWMYMFLTNEGLQYLIKELGLPADSKILPATHQKKRLVPKNEAGTEKVDDEGEEKPTKGE